MVIYKLSYLLVQHKLGGNDSRLFHYIYYTDIINEEEQSEYVIWEDIGKGIMLWWLYF